MDRNEGLPVSYLAEALLDVRPFEEPSAAASRFPRQGRTPVYQGGDLCVCTGGSRPTLFPSLRQRDIYASYCSSSEFAIAPCLGKYPLGRLHNEQLHSTMPTTLPRLPDWLASDSVPCNATLPTSAADLASVPGFYVPSPGFTFPGHRVRQAALIAVLLLHKDPSVFGANGHAGT
jgi:hypothetical protein